jgi:hypothetical protein
MFPFALEPKQFTAGKGCRITYRLLKDADVTFTVKDYKNNIVWLRTIYKQAADEQAVEWNGRDNNDKFLPAGEYRMEIAVTYATGETDENFTYVSITADITDSPPVVKGVKQPLTVTGSAGVRYQNNFSEKTEGSEERTNISLNYIKDNHDIRATFDALKMPTSDWDFRNSKASAAYKASGEKYGYLASFRDTIGEFDDPMKLFTDWKADRSKTGGKVYMNTEKLKAEAIGLVTPTPNGEKGYGGRVKYLPVGFLQIGATHAGRSYALPSNAETEVCNNATAADAIISIGKDKTIKAEYAESNDTGTSTKDRASRIEAAYNGQIIRFNAGWQEVGKDFKADYAYLKYGSDVKGPDAEAMLIVPFDTFVLSRPVLSVSGSHIDNIANTKTTDDLRGNFRASLFRKLNVNLDGYLNYVSDREGSTGGTSKSGQIGLEYLLKKKVIVRFSERLSSSGGSDSTDARGEYEHGFGKDNRLKTMLERIETKSGTDRNEENINEFDLKIGRYNLLVRNRFSKTSVMDWNYNFYGRADVKLNLYKTLDAKLYAAYGAPYGAKSTDIIECGMEVRF